MERSCELLHIRFFCMHSYVNRIVITRCRESPQPYWKRGRKCKARSKPPPCGTHRHSCREHSFFIIACTSASGMSPRGSPALVAMPLTEADQLLGGS